MARRDARPGLRSPHSVARTPCVESRAPSAQWSRGHRPVPLAGELSLKLIVAVSTNASFPFFRKCKFARVPNCRHFCMLARGAGLITTDADAQDDSAIGSFP